jgi:hypothetical protein
VTAGLLRITSKLAAVTDRPLQTFRGNKKPLLMREEVGKTIVLFSFSPTLSRQAGFGTSIGLASNRLPWLHRASPSATLHEIRCINGCGYIDSLSESCQYFCLSISKNRISSLRFWCLTGRLNPLYGI